ncbi:hypothetical protein ATK17_3928 [Branchiibius hedensis]|uniref:Uncharacterized protein n=1 Tax=Branchiibius hedensis TaxID=672460 RepID=A0A2Y9BN19_9MICO|nr:hypothetical protein [Branchiibius hedensis]PWJ23037.1 hypothetical protein ATK17_3928 [Branchiibius hedensis]SSA59113.1 hypothetical protein SAMN04489750_3928 [Branchiibius hedensis]
MNLIDPELLRQIEWAGGAFALYLVLSAVAVVLASTVSCRAAATFLIVAGAVVAAVLLTLPQLRDPAVPAWWPGCCWAAVVGCALAAAVLMARPDHIVKLRS